MQPVTSPIPQLEFEDAALDKHLGLISMDRPKIVFDFGPANRLLGGIYPCQMTAFGASPGAGKTTLMGQLADGSQQAATPSSSSRKNFRHISLSARALCA